MLDCALVTGSELIVAGGAASRLCGGVLLAHLAEGITVTQGNRRGSQTLALVLGQRLSAGLQSSCSSAGPAAGRGPPLEAASPLGTATAGGGEQDRGLRRIF